jgi:hypothetical protein
MVQARALLRQEPADRRLRAKRGQQLDMALADVEQDRLDALLGHRLAMHERHPERVAVERDCAVEVLDGYADVIDAAEHAGGV